MAALPSTTQNATNDAAKLTKLVWQIEIWKVKKLIKRLEAARGNGTSMISLIIRMFPNLFFPLKAGEYAAFLRYTL